MKKQRIQLGIAFLVLILCIAGFFLAKQFSKNAAEETTSEADYRQINEVLEESTETTESMESEEENTDM
ncbi:MAG: hypothetical protein ACI39N_06765 [Lachnospiraceae bacterium]